MSRRRGSAKTLIIADDEEVEDEELNPFSFKEFLRWKNQDLDPVLDQDQTDPESSAQKLIQVGTVTFDPEAGFFSEPSLTPQEAEDKSWGRSFHSGVYSSEEEETRFSSRPEVQQTGATGGAENYEGDDETSVAETGASCRSSHIQQLKEENTTLRRTIREFQRRSEANEGRVLELSEELHQRRHQEEKEAKDLESMVQSVEENLHLMTKRALRAETSVSRLKQELQQLQVEVHSLRSENSSLKAETEVITTMRSNAQVASEYLNKMAGHAHSSVRQLMGEVETLHLVSELLKSIDRISTVSES